MKTISVEKDNIEKTLKRSAFFCVVFRLENA